MIEARGKALADALARDLQPRAARFRELSGRPATLAAVAADDSSGLRFVEVKRTVLVSTGFELRTYTLGAGSANADVLPRLHELNADAGIDAVFLQLPLPPGVDPQLAADIIDATKDVDAVGSVNLGRVLAGTHLYLPATVAAVLRLIEDELGELRGRSLLLAGGAGVTERCISLLAVARGGTVCVLPPADPALADAAAGADAIVITGELPPGESLRHVRNGALLLDAAYAEPPRQPGWLPQRALERIGTYFPQYRNVGPLTIALLMQATLRAAFLLRD
jgi:methylenetetrahydrofolate dehydrogenase (NADP+)/methenyltetrahydrofolate cyclohydrolase